MSDDLESSLVVQGHEPTCLKVRRADDATARSAASNEVDSLEDVVLLECPYCQRKDFDSVAPLTSHIRTAHARPSDNLFTCVSCGLAFATLAKLEQHQNVEHHHVGGGTGTSSSDGTPGTAVSVAGSASLSGGHGGGSPSPGALTEPRWSCRFCPVQFYDAETQRDHEESIHLNRAASAAAAAAAGSSVGMSQSAAASTVVFCSQCSLGFAHIYALADHMHHSHGYNTRPRHDLLPPPPPPPSSSSAAAAPARHELAPTTHPGTDASPASHTRDPVIPITRDLSARVTVNDWLTRDPVVRPTAVRADSVDLGVGRAAVAASTNSATVATCGECSATFDSDDDVESHAASAHYLSLGTEYGCTSCLKLYARPEELQKHLMDVHAHHLYRCTLCKHVFDSKVSNAAAATRQTQGVRT